MSQSEVKSTGRPLQRIPWSDKIADGKQWFKRNADYYISLSQFHFTGTNRKDVGLLYQVYNGEYPKKWFEHITDPLSAKDPKHKRFPGKIRPVSILRTNIDLLLNEYPRRPFVYQVNNMGEDGYSSFQESLKQKVQENLTQHFVAMMQDQAHEQGLPVNQVPGLDEVELPESVKEKFTASYKDATAIKGQHWMTRAVKEYRIRETLHKMFKDWLIAGQVRSYKGIERGNLIYKRISPLNIDHDKSPDLDYIEDGEWVVARELLTYSDVVDHFYDDIDNDDLDSLEQRTSFTNPTAFYQYLSEAYNREGSIGKVPVYHIVWKGKKKVLFISYPDPVSGEMQEIEVDEDYPVNKEAGEKAEVRWVNEVYETWRLGNDIYTRMQPIPVQRNEMNNSSMCKLPYNGRNFSDLHAVNTSVMEIGLPFQIMYMIVNRTLEMTIAKSKGKILLIDKNAIPRGDGWDDEKFFYYAEGLGYGLMNRNQQGVDKTWNQYQVLDMGLFDHIKNLIDLQNHFKQQWDDAIGINRPRKGETYASDGKAVSEMGIMQSSVITDSIFNYFEQFTERELQGILDYSKFVNVDGIRSIYNSDDFNTALMEVDPSQYCSANLGILMSNSVEEFNQLNQLKQQMQAMIQNQVKPSTVLEMVRSQNVAELLVKLKKIEEIEAEMQQQQQTTEQEAEQQADERKMKFAQFENSLQSLLIDKEWDRKDQNTMIKGEYDYVTAGNVKAGEDSNNNGIPDIDEVQKRVIEKQKMLIEEERKRDELRTKERIHMRDDATKRAEIASREKIARDKNKADIKKARYSKKPKS